MFYVEVLDPPDGPTSRPLHFRLGPFAGRSEAEAMALRAQATHGGTVAQVIEEAGAAACASHSRARKR